MPKSHRGKRFAVNKQSPGTPAPAAQKAPPQAAAAPAALRQPAVAIARKSPAGKATQPQQYPFVRSDLIRVGVVTGITIAVLIVFAIILQ